LKKRLVLFLLCPIGEIVTVLFDPLSQRFSTAGTGPGTKPWIPFYWDLKIFLQIPILLISARI